MSSLVGMFTNRPIPGQGLTRNPDAPLPVEMPPRFVEMEDALEWIYKDLTSDKKLGSIVQVLSSGKVRVDVIAASYIEQGILEGRWNTDMAHLLIEPVLFVFLWLASQAGAPVKFASLRSVDLEGFDILDSIKKKKTDKDVKSLLIPVEDVPSEEIV